jgi:hypothetical protein
MRDLGRGITLLALFGCSLSGCGRSPAQPAGPDSVVTFAIKAAQDLRLDPATSPGGEPTVSFRWTEVLTATGGPGATVRASRGELRESSSQTVLAFGGLPSGTSVRPGAPLERPVVVAGVHSAPHAGQWEGRASVDIVHASGRVETLQAAFSFN